MISFEHFQKHGTKYKWKPFCKSTSLKDTTEFASLINMWGGKETDMSSSFPYTENIQLGFWSLFIAGPAAHRSPLMTFQWAPLMATAWCSASFISITKTWSCIWQTAGTQGNISSGQWLDISGFVRTPLTSPQAGAMEQTVVQGALLVLTEEHSQEPETQSLCVNNLNRKGFQHIRRLFITWRKCASNTVNVKALMKMLKEVSNGLNLGCTRLYKIFCCSNILFFPPNLQLLLAF